MGESTLEGKLKLFVDGRPIGTMVSDAQFDLSAGDAYSSVSVWNGNKIECSFEVKDIDGGLRRMIENMRRRDRYARKALLYAVTHGYNVQLFCRDEKGDDVMMVVLTPRLLRRLFRVCPVVPLFRVYDRNGKECRIRKGKVL